MKHRRIAILEFVCGGGLATQPLQEIPTSLFREGRAMLHALSSDWARLTAWDVFICWDSRLGECEIPGVTTRPIDTQDSFIDAWRRLANEVDYVLVIAPEIDNQLVVITHTLRACGACVLNADSVFLEAASDKWLTARAFQRANVSHPKTLRVSDFIRHDAAEAENLIVEGTYLPVGARTGRSAHPTGLWTIKPCDGAGCQEVMRFESLDEVRLFIEGTSPKDRDWDRYLIQPWIEGISASVAVLCGPRQLCVLPAMLQRLALDPRKPSRRVLYSGGEGPFHGISPEMLDDFASRVIRSLPGSPLGWVGIDFVVADSNASNQSIVAIEVNPRLTTSYLGVREIISENPAELLFQVASGLEIGFSLSGRATTFGVDHNLSQ